MRRLGRSAVFLLASCAACLSLRDRETPQVAGIAFSGTAGAAGWTGSFALDRMSKRDPELDGTARRTGTGRGVSIYVFDGGIYGSHPELAGRVRIGFDAYPSSPRVCNAHGTAVAGAAAGRSLGVAPDAQIIDVKIIECSTLHGGEDAILAAARWVIRDRRKHGNQPAVANWSFVIGTAADVPALDQAIAMLEDAGIVVVVAAGNYDRDACNISPAGSGLAFVVGASRLDRIATDSLVDARETGTAWGPCVDIYAPGDQVPLPNVVDGEATIGMWSGTSMATGYASGAAALVLEAEPSARPARVASVIRERATASVVRMRGSDSTGTRGSLIYIGPVP